MEIYFVTITVDQTAGQGKIFTEGNFPALPFPHVAEYCGCLGKSDGYWICAELDMSNKCDRVFLSTPPPPPPGRCVTDPPKTDKHGIHQGSGKHVTSSTLQTLPATLSHKKWLCHKLEAELKAWPAVSYREGSLHKRCARDRKGR